MEVQNNGIDYKAKYEKIRDTKAKYKTKWQQTEHGKKLKSFHQRIYLAKQKGNWEKVAMLETEKQIYMREAKEIGGQPYRPE